MMFELSQMMFELSQTPSFLTPANDQLEVCVKRYAAKAQAMGLQIPHNQVTRVISTNASHSQTSRGFVRAVLTIHKFLLAKGKSVNAFEDAQAKENG